MTTATQSPTVTEEPVDPGPASGAKDRSLVDRVRVWLGRRAAPAATALTTVALWEWLVSTGLPPSSIASPTMAWNAFAEAPGDLWFHVWPTLSAALIGFGVATSLAVLVSLVTVALPRSTSLVYNASVVTYSVPLIALAPVLLVWIGNGPGLRVTIAAIAGFFPVVVGCIQGFNAADPSRVEMLDQLSASRLQQFRLLTIPEALPYVFAGLKVAAASAVIGAIISEWSGADRGLGLAMINALSGYKPGDLWMIIIASSVLTIGLYGSIQLIERLVVRWDYDRDAVTGRT